MEQRGRGHKNPQTPATGTSGQKRMVDIATGDLNQRAPAAKELAIALWSKGRLRASGEVSTSTMTV